MTTQKQNNTPSNIPTLEQVFGKPTVHTVEQDRVAFAIYGWAVAKSTLPATLYCDARTNAVLFHAQPWGITHSDNVSSLMARLEETGEPKERAAFKQIREDLLEKYPWLLYNDEDHYTVVDLAEHYREPSAPQPQGPFTWGEVAVDTVEELQTEIHGYFLNELVNQDLLIVEAADGRQYRICTTDVRLSEQPVEEPDDLEKQRRIAADAAYGAYPFDSRVADATVADVDGWEVSGDRWSRIVYLDVGLEYSERWQMTLGFHDGTADISSCSVVAQPRD